MKKSADETALDHVKEFLINRNFDIHQSTGANRIIIGVIGDTETLDTGVIERMPGVLQVIRITKEE
jgi:DAHP synthase ferredoxin-like domain